MLEDDFIQPRNKDKIIELTAEQKEAKQKAIEKDGDLSEEDLPRTRYQKFKSANNLALSGIHITITRSVYSQIKTITDAREAWRKLRELYCKNTEAMFEQAMYKVSSIQQEDYTIGWTDSMIGEMMRAKEDLVG